MNELVERLAARAGSNEALAKQAVAKKAVANKAVAKKAVAKKKALAKKAVNRNTAAIILSSLRDEGAADKIQAQIDKIPGAEAPIEAPNGGGWLVGLMGGVMMALGGKLIRMV
jgi:hypothetical protein